AVTERIEKCMRGIQPACPRWLSPTLRRGQLANNLLHMRAPPPAMCQLLKVKVSKSGLRRRSGFFQRHDGIHLDQRSARQRSHADCGARRIGLAEMFAHDFVYLGEMIEVG